MSTDLLVRDIAAEVWLASREETVTRWDIPSVARSRGCTWEKVWEAFAYAEEEYGVYVGRNAFLREAHTALKPIRKRLMSDGYEIVPEYARGAYERD